MALTIPDRDHDRFARFFALDLAALNSLYDALKATPPRLRIREVVDEITPRVQIDRAVLKDIVRLLVTLYSVRADRSLEPTAMADEVVIAAQQTTDARLKNPAVGWAVIKQQLTRFLDLDQFGVTAKAVFIAYQYPSHFHSARVLTDARPVFANDPNAGPSAFIINHVLNVVPGARGDDDNEIFLSMNSTDLTKLRKAIDRALAKEKSLRTTLSKTGLPILSEGTME